MKRPARTPSQLSESLHRQVNAYALAASAAGVTMLALAQPAEARIIYTKAHRSIPPNTHYDVDLNHDGDSDFTLFNNLFYHSRSNQGANLQISMHGNSAEGYYERFGKYGEYLASDLPAGVEIEANKKFMYEGMVLGFSFNGPVFGTYSGGGWRKARNRYLGLRFFVEGKIHYGWARLSTTCANFKCTELLTGYAYETIPNKPIKAGQTHSRDEATLGRLAQGASGVAVRRQKQ